jgi:hypothetical protein
MIKFQKIFNVKNKTMKILTAYTKGLLKSASSLRILILIWVLNLIMALLLAIPFYTISRSTAGNSMLPDKLISEFNFTAATEWLRESGNITDTFLILALCVASAYYLIWIFVSGGIIQSLDKSRFTKKRFWNGSAKNFFRFLGVSAIILFVQVILAVIVIAGVSAALKGLNETAVSEDESIHWILSGGALFMLLWLYWSAVSDYAKFYLVKNNSINVFGAFFRTFIFSLKSFFNVYFLRFLLFLTPIPVWYIFWKLSGSVEGTTWIGLIILILIHQLFLIIRIWFRVWVYSSQLKMFLTYFPNNKQLNIELRRKAKLEKKAAKQAIKNEPVTEINSETELEE